MKCPYCGGEVSSQSVKCPFCGRENQEGIAFQEEVQKKIERNKLLKPFLIKQKTPELVQKMLTRIWIILIALHVILFVGTFVIFMWGEQSQNRKPISGSFAEQYISEYDVTGNFEYDYFCELMQKMMDAEANGETLSDFQVEYLVEYAYKTIAENTENPGENAEEIEATVYAFFRGYLGFEEADMDFLLPDENGEYEFSIDENKKEAAIQLVWEKLEVAWQ